MVDTANIISNTNAKIVGAFTNVNIMNIISWGLVFIVLIGGGIWFYIWDRDRKLFVKRITAFRVINNEYIPSMRDKAKVAKIGSGGFEILYLKKLKTWKIGYGGEIGKTDYYFFIGPDGYWYPGRLSADMHLKNKQNGYIPVITTNPTMRSQYTSLEKQIDDLHKDKPKFWDKYGMWILNVVFVVIAGLFLWLNYQEYVKAMGELQGLAQSMRTSSDNMVALINALKSNLTSNTNTGLIPVGAPK